MLERMRIASLVPEDTIEAIYRSLIPMQELVHRGHTVHVEERNAIPDPAALADFDVVQISRICHPAVTRLVRQLHQRGIGVVWDTDDQTVAVIGEDRTLPGEEGMLAQRWFAALRGIAGNADAVTTPSPVLADVLAAESGREVRILDNRLPPTFRRPERVMPHQGVTLCWHARLQHAESFTTLGIRDTLERLMARHSHLSITAIGLDLEIRSHRYRWFEGIAYGGLPQYFAHCDIAIVPLTDTPVNRARSVVKLKEYAAAGVPWLASPVGAFADKGEQHGGRLVPDDGWTEAIEELMNDADLRRVLAQRGQRWAAGETIEAHADAWEQTFQQAVERARTPQASRR